MATSQVTIYLDTAGILHAEAPGENGSRRKLDLASLDQSDIFESLRNAVFALGEDLISQRTRELDRKRREALRTKKLEVARHARIVEYTAAHYPSALKYVDPRVLRVTQAMHDKLRADGYSSSDIQLMAKRGELVGTAFFTMPRVQPTSSASQPKPRSERSTKFAALEEAISQIQL